MSSIKTETETVIKRVLPYLRHREYLIEDDVDFETAIKSTARYSNGYVDLLVTCGDKKPKFLIEAKRTGKKLSDKDRLQALDYGRSVGALFVVVTNGSDIQCFNSKNGQAIRWDGKLQAKIPSKSQLTRVLKALQADKDATDIPLAKDSSLPFRPALPLKQLNALFQRCHAAIRKIEKNEEHAFADFSKILFLKLLEEKADRSGFVLPYSFRFHELAEKSKSEADQVKAAVLSMITSISADPKYGDVLADPIRLKQPQTFQKIVRELSAVSFDDSGLDTKGAAFEYFVRATLKGKKLGQYFTPRQLVEIMVAMVNVESIVSATIGKMPIKVLDPACGTGGFLVYTMKEVLSTLESRYRSKSLTKPHFDAAYAQTKASVFFGADANDGVAAAAKMNMIIAGDGHSNIRAEDTLRNASRIWTDSKSLADIVLTNPPFGTSETESLPAAERAEYEVASTKGQHLFLDRIFRGTEPGGVVCTVIDDGVLNTDSAKAIRDLLLRHCDLEVVVSLPDETFKPNKINVRASVLLLRKKDAPQADPYQSLPVRFVRLESLGYDGSGELIRGFDFSRLRNDFATLIVDRAAPGAMNGQHWSSFDVSIEDIVSDQTRRMDLKYWHPATREKMDAMKTAGAHVLKSLNKVKTQRGRSPAAESYVDEADGYAVVVKAGSNISNKGAVEIQGADYIEKIVYDELPDSCKIIKGDILLSSTGDGTLGKCAVFESSAPAVADGHVTVIRVDPDQVDPYFLCDYLRVGFGAKQVRRLYTGSTGLIELSPDRVDEIVIDLPASLAEQSKQSQTLRAAEKRSRDDVASAIAEAEVARTLFASGVAVGVISSGVVSV